MWSQVSRAVPTDAVPRDTDPAMLQGHSLPSSSLPGLRIPRCIQGRIHRDPGAGGACHLLHCQQMKVCCSLRGCEAVGLLPWLGGSQTWCICQRHHVSLAAGLLMAPPAGHPAAVAMPWSPQAQQVRRSWGWSQKKLVELCPGEHCGSLLQTPSCLSQ